MCGLPKTNCSRLQQFLPQTQYLLVFAARSCGDLYSWHWNAGLGLLAEISLPYLYPHVEVGPAVPLLLTLLPVWMDVVSLIP